jgi:putative hydrolase of the HAD superfamily
MTIRAVLWDIDDTLVDYTHAEWAGAVAFARGRGLAGRYGDERALVEEWHAVMARHYERYLAGELGFLEQRRARVREFTGEAGLGDAEADAVFAEYEVLHEAAWRAFPDVLPALAALEAAAPGLRHGLLSNSAGAVQERKLAATGLRGRFATLVCSEEAGVAKPAAGAFLAGCAALGMAPEETAYVGDRADVDGLGAVGAGLVGVWVDRPGARGTAPEVAAAALRAGVLRIGGLDELVGALGPWLVAGVTAELAGEHARTAPGTRPETVPGGVPGQAAGKASALLGGPGEDGETRFGAGSAIG